MVEIIEVTEGKKETIVKHELDNSYKCDSGLEVKEERDSDEEKMMVVVSKSASFSSGYDSSAGKIDVKWNDPKTETEQRFSEQFVLQSSNVNKGKRVCDISSIEHVSFMPKSQQGEYLS